MRYALYARKSHDDTKLTEKSLNDQIAVWHDSLNGSDFDIIREYRESKSAKDPDVRPLFRDMVKRIKRGEIDGILTWHINRLARNMVEGGVLADLLMRGTLREIRTPNAVFRPKDNIIPLILEAATATQNNRDQTEAMLRGTNSRIEEGGWTHRAPLGYLNRRDSFNPKRGLIITDPQRFELVQKAWQLLLTGSYNVQQVIDTVNDTWGLRTRQTPRRGGGRLNRSHGYRIFSSVFYAGYTQREGVIRKGSHQPMISLAEFHQVQKYLGRGLKPYGRRQFAFTGLIRCGECGLQVTAEYHYKSGKGRIYYHCSNSRQTCTKRGINEEDLQSQVVGLLDRITIEPRLCAIAVETIERWQDTSRNEAEGAMKRLLQSLESVENQLKNLLSLRLRDVVTDDTVYKDKEAELVAERNYLRLAVQEAGDEAQNILQTLRNGAAYAAFARDYFRLADVEKKREYARSLGTYELKDRRVSIVLNPILAELVKFADSLMAIIEPGIKGSESLYRATFRCPNTFGWAEEVKLEPVASLIAAARQDSFPDLFPGERFNSDISYTSSLS